MFDSEFLQLAILAGPAILFALTVHEFFHAWTAFKLGDPTARDLGRVTLNPIKHLDPFGTIMMFVSHFTFGWAKPVPFNPMNLKNPRRDDILITAAGPLSNIGLAIIFGTIYRIAISGDFDIGNGLFQFLYLSVRINVGLAFFNMIPLFPLDGSHILRNLLPEKYDHQLEQFEKIAPFILLIVIFTGFAWVILSPFVTFFINLFMGHQVI